MQSKYIALVNIVALLLITIASQVVFGQNTGLLKGEVSDLNGDGIDYAKVIVTKELIITADKDGKYELVLPEGAYMVTAQAKGFSPSTVKGVIIRAGQETNIKHVLVFDMDNVVCILYLEAAKEEKLAPVEVDVKIEKLESKEKRKRQKRKSNGKRKHDKLP